MSGEAVFIQGETDGAVYKTGLSGWVSRTGQFWGKDERMARWSGATHIRCECGEVANKSYTICATCREKKAVSRYEEMPKKDWDGVTPLYSDAHDRYFFDIESLIDYLTDEKCSIADLRLVICRPNYPPQLEADFFHDQLPEDEDELPAILEEAVENYNKAIAECPPLSWSPGKIAAIVSEPALPEARNK